MEDDSGISCFYPKNFEAEYDDGRAKHYLDADMYAMSAEAVPGSWVLLAKVSGKKKGKRPAAAASGGATAAVGKMTEEMKAAYRAALDACE